MQVFRALEVRNGRRYTPTELWCSYAHCNGRVLDIHTEDDAHDFITDVLHQMDEECASLPLYVSLSTTPHTHTHTHLPPFLHHYPTLDNSLPPSLLAISPAYLKQHRRATTRASKRAGHHEPRVNPTSVPTPPSVLHHHHH